MLPTISSSYSSYDISRAGLSSIKIIFKYDDSAEREEDNAVTIYSDIYDDSQTNDQTIVNPLERQAFQLQQVTLAKCSVQKLL